MKEQQYSDFQKGVTGGMELSLDALRNLCNWNKNVYIVQKIEEDEVMTAFLKMASSDVII